MAEMIAHVRNDGKVQSLEDHLGSVSDYAEKNCNKIGLKGVGTLLGLLHDLGKATAAFQDYIRGHSDCNRGEIDHSTAGAQHLCVLFGENLNSYQQLA